MSNDDTIFLAADMSLPALVGWMAGALQLEQLADPQLDKVDVRIAVSRDELVQMGEARAIFDELAAMKPPVALVLVTAMSWIVAAYLPGVGVHTFPPRTTPDADDLDAWRPWVVTDVDE